MREDLLHFIWKYKKVQLKGLHTTKGEAIVVESVGTHNTNAGPDFFNAKLTIGSQLWAGNVELHIKASDWYAHNHEVDENYNNVILHVVWEDDATIFRADNSEIPTLELKAFIAPTLLKAYQNLFDTRNKNFINCEKEIGGVDQFLFQNWLDRLFIERLEKKSAVVFNLLKESKNDWEQVLFVMLMKNFGSIINGESFYAIAKSIDYKVFRKICNDPVKTESLLLGAAGLLGDKDVLDVYYSRLNTEYTFLKRKFKVADETVVKAAFYRLRPTNFPTIRLSQIANLYGKHQTLFAVLMRTTSLKEMYEVFNVAASAYWDDHYTFGKISRKSSKKITKSFVQLIVINTILPLRFCYAKHLGKDENEIVLNIISSLQKEKNSIVTNFTKLTKSIHSAKESQAILELYSNYCLKNKCLQCAVGSSLLSRNN
ncbi:DUF2851 family protein [Cellulophaga sp. F20128]|uniref:DUF2851 family protein n=1 Tax=Cellulophaga sp. F20128 TaxID=2926413 RepID=UPI001FF3953D|nr:DUF2851 family protein [Cellulophaga sp. F20128]MCK0158406.1 DUF2851 family protein [Cellulophaga sp. F20128]